MFLLLRFYEAKIARNSSGVSEGQTHPNPNDIRISPRQRTRADITDVVEASVDPPDIRKCVVGN
jgi:hypothetical protein